MPRMKMTPMVRLTLYGLCLYLAVMLTLIGISFTRLARSEHASGGIPVTQPAAQAATSPTS